MRGMVRLAGDLGLTEDDMNLLYSKYERNGAFNYYAFCKDMDQSGNVHGVWESWSWLVLYLLQVLATTYYY